MYVVYVSGSRADYSPMRTVLRAISRSPGMRLGVVLTGMHLARDEAGTARYVRADRLRIVARARANAEADTGVAMGRAFGRAVDAITVALARARPHVVLLQGDRDEILAAAIAAAHVGVPIVHLGGGDRSGSIDDADRDAISRFASLHLVGTKAAAARLTRMGVDRRDVRVVGEPGLDDLVGRKRPGAVHDRIVLVQHPVVGEATGVADLSETIAALDRLALPVIATYPNTDAGGRAMRKELIRAAARRPHWRVVSNAPSRAEWLDLLLTSRVIVGNSSSAIIEAPSAGLPAVNVGTRQRGRLLRARNVIDVAHDRSAIAAALRHQVAASRRRRGRAYANPYGSGRTAPKVVSALRSWWRRRTR